MSSGDKNNSANNRAVELWLEKNWKKCLAGMVAVIVVAMAVFFVFYQRNSNAEKIALAFAGAPVDKLPALLVENSDAPGASVARLRLASYLQMEKKDFSAAKIQYDLLAADKNLPQSVRENARISAAKCEESLGRTKEAAETLFIIFNDASVISEIRNEAGFQAARLFSGLNDPRAKIVFEKLSQFPETASLASAMLKTM